MKNTQNNNLMEYYPVPPSAAVADAGRAGAAVVPPSSDTKTYLQLVRRNASRLLVTALLASALTGIWLMSAERVYETSALLRIENDSGFMDKLLEKESNVFSTVPLAKEESKVLGSRAVLGTVVDAQGLTIEAVPERLPLLGRALSRFPVVAGKLRQWFPDSGYAWGEASLEVSYLEVPERLYGRPLTLVALGSTAYRLELEGETLIERGQVGLFVPFSVGTEPGFSLLVDRIDAEPGTRFKLFRYAREAAIEQLRHALTINAREKGTHMMELVLKGNDPERLASVLNGIVRTYRDLRLSWSSGETRQELAFLETRLPEARKKLAEAEEALAAYQKAHRSIDLSSESRQAVTRTAEIEAELRILQMKKDLLSKQYTPAYPELVRLEEEIASMTSLLAGLRQKVSIMPGVSKELISLEREVDLRGKLYTSLEQRFQTLKVVEASSLGSVRLIDSAVVPDKPVWPKPALLVPLAVLSALFLHLAWLFVREAFSGRLQSAEAVEKLSGVPVYVDIPFSTSRVGKPASVGRNLLPRKSAGGGVLAMEDPTDFTVETLRGLRAMLGGILAHAHNKMLMICGPLPKMGKSFVSANLAVLLAEAGKRVLLVDGDFLRGRLHADFGISNEIGLTSVVAGEVGPSEAVTATAIPGLDIMPRGPGKPPNDAMLEVGLRKLVEGFSDTYDHIVVDAPPILSLSTSAIIGRVAGASIMVVRTDEVTVDEMKSAVKRLRLAGVGITGCLVNNMSPDSHRHAYRYGYSG